jgi:hypothetical protein
MKGNQGYVWGYRCYCCDDKKGYFSDAEGSLHRKERSKDRERLKIKGRKNQQGKR